ncbi:MAG: hypothetical protein Q9195_000894 [Heterodermia aff. obscurata]
MVLNPSAKTIIICISVAIVAIVSFLVAWVLRSRKRRRLTNGRSSLGLELTHSSRNPRDKKALTRGRSKEPAFGFTDDPSRQQELPSPYTDAREAPQPPRRSQQEKHEGTRQQSTSRQDPTSRIQSRGFAPPQPNNLCSIESALYHDETRIPNHTTLPPSSTITSQPHQQPTHHLQPATPPSSSLLPPTPETATTNRLTTPISSPSLLYHSHLHPTPPTTHLHVPPRHRALSLPSASATSTFPSPSSLLSSSADSTLTLSKHVNPAYLAAEQAKLSASSGKRRRWMLLGLGSENGGSSDTGSKGWVVKGKPRRQPTIKQNHKSKRSKTSGTNKNHPAPDP